MRPLLDNLSLVDDIDAMGRPYRTQPMRNDEDRTPLADLRHVLLNHRFGLVVQRAGRSSGSNATSSQTIILLSYQSVSAFHARHS